jgi:hypothetical protein
MGIYKVFTNDVTQIEGEEMRAIADLLKLGNQPGLIGHADLADPTIVGTTIALHAFAPDDVIVTAGAFCEAYYADVIDFATAAPGGGPLPAGAYTIYVQIMGTGTVNRVYQCYPLASKESAVYECDDPAHSDAYYLGTVDEYKYLVVGTVTWNGTDTLGGLVDSRTGKWGVADFALLGRGSDDEVWVDGARDWRFKVPVYFDRATRVMASGSLQVDDYLAIGQIGFTPIINILADCTMLTGDSFWWSMQGDTIINQIPGVGLTLSFNDLSAINMFTGSKITIPTGGAPEFLFEVMAGPPQVMQIDGAIVPLVFKEADFAGTPAKNQITGASIIKAWAKINDDGSIESSYNVDSVTHGAVGEYVVNYLRDFDGGLGCPVATPIGTAGASSRTANVNVHGAWSCEIHTMKTVDQTAVDCAFLLIVAGGEQAA